MREFLSKLKLFRAATKERAKKIDYRLRIFLYSLPFFGFLASAENVKAAGGTGLVGAAVSGVANLAGSIIGSGVEAGATLLVWVWIINQLSEIVSDIAGGVFLFLINFLIGVSQYNSFLGSSVVTIGWSVTRDLANMFLVVALLVIAFGTILSVNSYQASSLLKQFLFAAILVNFSKTICGVLIDASQVVMMTFVSGYSETAAGNFVNMFQVEKWLQLAIGNASNQLGQAGSVQTTTMTGGVISSVVSNGADVVASIASNLFSGVAANVFTAIIAFIGIIAVLSLDIILVVRIVTLWFLIVASPIAFVAKVLPVTKGFSGRWWSAFNQQLVAGPVVAFIVWISLASISVSDTAFSVINQAGQGDKLFTETTAATSAVAATKISQWENLALYFVPIVIFMLGAKWAVSISGGFAKSIAGFASKQVKGVGMGALARVRRTALTGKGDFSVLTAAKKGFVGERSGITSMVGRVGGVTLGVTGIGAKVRAGSERGDWIGTAARGAGKLGAIGGAVAGVAGMTAAGRAVKAARYKNLKTDASKFGFGEYGTKRKDAIDAEALNQHYNEIARQKFEYYSEKAKNAKNDDEKREFEEQALGWKNTYETKAGGARKKAEEYQKALFELEGQTNPIVLVQTLKQRAHDGSVSELELDVADDLINAHYEKEEKKRIEKAKAAAGENWSNVSKFEEDRIKGQVAAEKSEIKGRMRQITQDANRTILGKDEVNRREQIQSESEKYRDNFVKNTKKFDPNEEVDKSVKIRDTAIRDAHNASASDADVVALTNQANKDLAKAIGAHLEGLLAQRPDVTQSEQEQLVMNAVGRMSTGERKDFMTELETEGVRRAQANSKDVELSNIVTALNTKFAEAEKSSGKYLDEVESRWSMREKNGSGSDNKYYNQYDIGMKRVKNGYKFDSENVVKFQAVIANDPDLVIPKLSPEVMSNPEVRRAVGGAVTDVKHLQELITRINVSENESSDPGGVQRKGRINSLLRGIKESSRSDKTLFNEADNILRLNRAVPTKPPPF